MPCVIRIGTSGWHYKHWRELFYPVDLPASMQLSFYSKTFHTVEINNTFYALPAEKTVQNWRSAAPEDFRFAVKASRYITHVRKLNEPEEPLRKFFQVVASLKEKLGPILFQFPPNWRVNLDRVKSFLALLPREDRYAFEFRNESWFTPSVYRLLNDFNVSFCIFDRDGKESPLEITADYLYIRLHGGPFSLSGQLCS